MFGAIMTIVFLFIAVFFVGYVVADSHHDREFTKGYDKATEGFTKYGWIVARNGGIHEIEVEDEHGNYHRYKRID